MNFAKIPASSWSSADDVQSGIVDPETRWDGEGDEGEGECTDRNVNLMKCLVFEL
jgi:hypothetical protein